MQQPGNRTPRNALLSSLSGFLSGPLSVFLLAVAIFVADTVTDLEIAVAVFYVAVVLMSVRFCRKRGVVAVSAACMVLTLVSFLLTLGGSFSAGVINGLISATAIAITTGLVLKMENARVAMETAQAHLAHIARITVLGEMTASIAHEINQPLAAVVTNGNACSRWLAAEPPNLERARGTIDRIVEDAVRASEVIARIRALARRTPAGTAKLDLGELVEETIALVQTEIRQNGVSVQTTIAEGLPPVLADKVQIQQVLLNLITNAMEAMRHAGGGPRELRIGLSSHADGHVLVALHDSGVGLGTDDPALLFEPFHTTKPEGMGMGLAISRTIVEAHGGRIWATPNKPRGAILCLTLPVL